MFRFIHAADLHLDSPFKGLKETNSTVGNRLRRATFDAYTTLIDLCIDRDVDCLVIAGDVFDGADKSLNGQLKFVDGLKRLEKHDIRVFICHGNHDPLDSWQAQLSLPKNVHRFTDKADYIREDAGGSSRYVVCGVSYPTQEVTDSLVGEFPKRDWPEFTIGLLHANVGGNSVHASYAPCTVEELTAVGYDYWALGHVHTRTILQDTAPWIGFPGNTQGRSRRETDERGVYVVDVGDDHRVNTEFVPVQAVRWEDRNVSIDGLETVFALDERLSMEVDAMRDAAGGCSVVYRIRLIGRGRVHRLLADPDSMQQLSDRQNEGVRGDREPFLWCTDIAKATASEIDLDGLRKGDDAVGDFLKLTKELGQESELAEQLAQELSPLFTSRISKRHLQGLVTTPADAQALLKKAESTALDLLVTDDSDLT